MNTPINSSLSVTMSQDDLKSITTASASYSFEKHRLWLNGREEDVSKNVRFQSCLDGVLKLAGDKVEESTGEVLVNKEEWQRMHVHVSSYNTFPTAAGLASSASGYAALVSALASLFCANETFEGELSTIARQGSGSACRSLYGGFVTWNQGHKDDGSDSIAVQVADENYWEDFRSLILVVSDKKKETSSTSGMQTSVETSRLISHRAQHIVPSRMKKITQAILERDFPTFATLTMMDSNQFHAICLGTYPPIFYLNDISKSIIHLVHIYNNWAKEIRVAYTFDAGPNAVLYTLDKYCHEIYALILYCFPPPVQQKNFFLPPHINDVAERYQLDSSLIQALHKQEQLGTVKLIYTTKCGPGPQILQNDQALLDKETGFNIFSP